MTASRIVICSNTAWSLYNFRRALIRKLVAQGFDVVAVSPLDNYSEKLPELGCRYVALPMDNRGTSPLRDIALFWALLLLLHRERPSAYVGFTVKPNIYGALAAAALGIPHLCNVTGLGATFIRRSWLTRVVKALYRLALHQAQVVFENTEDREVFVNDRLARADQVTVMPTTGIDLQHFAPLPRRRPDGELRFLLVARLLWDKGVGEFVAAAREVRKTHPAARFQLLGFLDVLNPAAIKRTTVEQWTEEGVVEYLGVTDDVRPFVAAADCVVLPSYREGLSRSLLEAAAMARPIIASDVPGCREAVIPAISGFLVPARQVGPLAAAFRAFCDLSDEQRVAMGNAGLNKARTEFDERQVVARYWDKIREMTLAT